MEGVAGDTGYLWWQTGVVYQIYPRSFQDTNGDGVGDLAGIITRLDYISDTLGVDAIWISPFYPSPMADFGYDVADYTDIDPLFGDLPTFDRLVAEAHARGIKIIIDFVPNHSSDQHLWFRESRASRDNPKRDWYFWRDAKPDGSPPNNWISAFGGSPWQWDETTQQFYLHTFLKEQPDLNWRNPAVKEAMFDAIRFWLERGVDGFRIDVAHGIMKDPALRDNPPNPNAGAWITSKPEIEFNQQLHIYDQGHEDIFGVYREFRQILDSYSAGQPRYSVGEIHMTNWQEWARYYGENNDALHMPFNFAFLFARWRADEIRKVVDDLEAVLPQGAWPNYVLSNHDESRIAAKFGRAQARVAGMLLLTLRGTPTLYYGDELGMTDVPIAQEDVQDPWGISEPGLSRDPERTPMQWDASANAGFTPAGVTPWLPVAHDYQAVNVEGELADPTSILNFYRRLLAHRKATPELLWGAYEAIDDVPDDCFVYLRQTDNAQVLVALNFSDQSRHLALSTYGTGQIALSTHMDRQDEVDMADLTLRPNEGLIIELSVAGY